MDAIPTIAAIPQTYPNQAGICTFGSLRKYVMQMANVTILQIRSAPDMIKALSRFGRGLIV
jgi:hypothetical protein